MTKRFENKVAVVTGAAVGMGYAAAEAFAAEGASVVLIDTDSEKLNAAVENLTGQGYNTIAAVADVSSAEQVARAVQAGVEAFGGIDVLFSNAGIQTYGTVVEMDEATWDKTLNINLKGIFLVSKYCIPEMIKRGGGTIVNMASVQGLSSQKRVAAYAASKGAIIAMTRTMALDHASDNIRVNAVAPGSVDTPMLRWAAELFVPENPTGAVDDWGKLHALGRVAKASEVAQAVLFLASEQASFVTGTTLVVDGGLSIQL